MGIKALSLLKATVLNLAVCAIWFLLEIWEYGAIQPRACDDVIWLIYLAISWILIYRLEISKEQK